jgi:hypothetical protein
MKKEWINYCEDWLKLYDESSDGSYEIWYRWDYVRNYDENDGFQQTRIFHPPDVHGPDLEKLVRTRFGDKAWDELLEAVAKAGTEPSYPDVPADRFNYVWPFQGDLAMVSVVTDSDRRGMVDRNGKLVIPPVFRDLGSLVDGRIRFQREVGGLFGYLDAKGKVVIAARFKDADDFMGDGKARVTTRQGVRRVINVRGRYVAAKSKNK